MCIIDQREVSQDATDFGTALRAVFREDADVVMVGEMRDLGNNQDGDHCGGNRASYFRDSSHQ